MHAKINIFALFLFFLAFSCSKPKDICIENCPEEICLLGSDGKVQIEVSNADQYNFYSHCLRSDIQSEFAFNVYDVDERGRYSQDFFIYLSKKDDFSWSDLEGMTFNFEDYAEVEGLQGFKSIYLRWHVKDRYGLDTDLVLDRKTKHTITFTKITNYPNETSLIFECKGQALNWQDRPYSFNANFEITIR